MAEPTRGICGVCGREVRVRVGDGRLWRHGYLTDTGPQTSRRLTRAVRACATHPCCGLGHSRGLPDGP
jgi:hypothetical protein